MDTNTTVVRKHIFEQQRVGQNTNHLQGNETKKTGHTVGLECQAMESRFHSMA